MSTESKRRWRERNPERSAAAERERAQARRDGYHSVIQLGAGHRGMRRLRLCASHDSYWRYEGSMTRFEQRLWYPIAGAGAHRMTKMQRAKAIEAVGRAEWDAMNARFGTNEPYPKFRRKLVAYR